MNITKFNKELLEVSQNILGPSRKKNETSEESWKMIGRRKTIKKRIINANAQTSKEQIQKEYSALDKEVKKSTKLDKKRYYEKLADKAEKTSQMQDMKTLYETSKQLCSTYSNNDVPIKDSNGKPLCSETEKFNRWKTHCESVLNREPQKDSVIIESAMFDLDINTQPPTLNEIKKAIENIKHGKAAGNDQVTTEMIQAEK